MQSSSRVSRKHYFISINNDVIYVAIHNRNYVISYIAVRTAVAFFFFSLCMVLLYSRYCDMHIFKDPLGHITTTTEQHYDIPRSNKSAWNTVGYMFV